MSRLIDRDRLTAISAAWHESKMQAISEGKEVPRIPEFVGVAIVHISRRFATSYKFSMVPEAVRDDMISNAQLTAVRAFFEKFSPDKCRNGDPFSFLTSAVRFGFLNAISSSKKYFEGKNAILHAIMDGVSAIDTGSYHSAHVESLTVVRNMTDTYRRDMIKDEELDGVAKYNARKKAELAAQQEESTKQ